MGAKVSDWIGDAALLRINEVHHNVALFPSSYAGIQHVNFQVDEVDDIMRSYYFLQARNVRIVFGPGRHPTRSEEHTSELQSLMRNSYAVFCLNKKRTNQITNHMIS